MTEAATAPALTSRGLSVLVAEDNEINALLMRSLLTRLGHQAVITTNGEEALESWLAAKSAGTPYDLVLMDIQMPGLDGIETTKRIRVREAAGAGRRTPILALTANTLVEDRYACFEAGMDGFLVKPLDREKLAEALAGRPPRCLRQSTIASACLDSGRRFHRALTSIRTSCGGLDARQTFAAFFFNDVNICGGRPRPLLPRRTPKSQNSRAPTP